MQVAVLIRESPASCAVSLPLWHLVSRSAPGEGKAEHHKLRGNSTQRLRLQPLIHTLYHSLSVRSWASYLPFLSSVSTLIKKSIWRRGKEGGESCLDISGVQACQCDNQLRKYRIRLRCVKVERLRSFNRQWWKCEEELAIRALCIINPRTAGAW